MNYVRQFFQTRVVFHTLYLLNEVGDPHFVLHFWHNYSNSLSQFKKIYPLENLCKSIIYKEYIRIEIA